MSPSVLIILLSTIVFFVCAYPGDSFGNNNGHRRVQGRRPVQRRRCEIFQLIRILHLTDNQKSQLINETYAMNLSQVHDQIETAIEALPSAEQPRARLFARSGLPASLINATNALSDDEKDIFWELKIEGNRTALKEAIDELTAGLENGEAAKRFMYCIFFHRSRKGHKKNGNGRYRVDNYGSQNGTEPVSNGNDEFGPSYKVSYADNAYESGRDDQDFGANQHDFDYNYDNGNNRPGFNGN